MAGRDVEELVGGIWCWERRPRGLRPGEFGGRTSYAVATESDMLLVDPLVDGDDDPVVDVLDDVVCGQVRILVTMPYHTRSAEWLWRRYRSASARIYGHPAVATRLDDVSGFETVLGGKRGRPHRPLSLDRTDAPLAAADRDPFRSGPRLRRRNRRDRRRELRIWAAPPDSDRRWRWWNAHYLPSLERLAELDIEHALVTHDRPAIGDGKEALQRALESGP